MEDIQHWKTGAEALCACSMFNDLSTPLSLLSSRRSGKPRDMVEPGPDATTLDAILAIASRTPDHGKLFPWRFVVVERKDRGAFAAMLRAAYLAEKPDAGRIELDAIDQFASQAPCLVVVLSQPNRESHIPVWEQELSAGAACMNLLAATHAAGFVGCWLTGWATYSEQVRAAFGPAGSRIAGFVFLGTPGKPLEERPRPAPGQVVGRWSPPGRDETPHQPA